VISLGSQNKYYLYLPPTDMRKGFDGLCGLILSASLGQVTDGHVYVFVNRRRDKIKLLIWDRNGLVLFYKRLEQGTIELPEVEHGQCKLHLSWQTLMFMLEGISLKNITRRKRFNPHLLRS